MARHRDAMVWVLTIERALVEVTEVLERAGVRSVVLKGPALARCAYPDPSWRPFRDLDLLVRTPDWRLTCGLLQGLGFRRCLPEPRHGFDERFAKAATFEGPDGLQVDLHRTLAEGPFGLWIDAEALHERTIALALGDRAVQRLDDARLALHAFVHASLGSVPPRLLALRDVQQLATLSSVDWEVVAEDARRWRLAAVVLHAWREATRILVVMPPPPILHELQETRLERRALARYTTDRRGRGGIALGTIGAIPGLRSKASFVRALLVPNRRFVQARAGTARSRAYLARWATPLRWLARGLRLDGAGR